MTAKQDVKLVLNNGLYDMQLGADGDILTEDFFDTALLMSIFCERRANSSEVVESHRRRGWIGNESTPGFEIGSKLWLYEQARINRDTLNGIETVTRIGLQWFVDDNIAINITISTGLSNGSVVLQIDITRSGSKVDRRYFTLWDNTGVL